MFYNIEKVTALLKDVGGWIAHAFSLVLSIHKFPQSHYLEVSLVKLTNYMHIKKVL